MVILRDVEVTVSAKGKRLQEYDDDAEEPSPSNAVTKYIEALTGTDFHIQYTIKPAFRLKSSGIAVIVTIDGEHMDSMIHNKYKDLKDLSRDDVVAASDPDLKKLVSKLGLIKVEVHQVTYLGRSATSKDDRELRALDTLPEKSLKGQALSHRASLGPAQRIASLRPADVRYKDRSSPFAVFNFKYRSRKSLQGMLVIPRTPSPVPLEQRPINELTHEEALELLRRRSALVKPEATPAATLKRGHDDLDPERKDDKEYVALLASARVQKVARFQEPVDVIDLLDD
ncbi:MAG: hypothetical protein LQ347_001340 [Umbilicaria vellea]|nr:MAG: hypothetical protein LQ347_001340 [Umbilicaria vellea]